MDLSGCGPQDAGPRVRRHRRRRPGRRVRPGRAAAAADAAGPARRGRVPAGDHQPPHPARRLVHAAGDPGPAHAVRHRRRRRRAAAACTRTATTWPGWPGRTPRTPRRVAARSRRTGASRPCWRRPPPARGAVGHRARPRVALARGADRRGCAPSAASAGVTLNTMVQVAWGIVLGALTGRSDVVFGGTVSGRPPEIPGIESMVGLFINTIPVRVTLDPGETRRRAARPRADRAGGAARAPPPRVWPTSSGPRAPAPPSTP